MPFGDRTGPRGQVPMTGRGRGYCAGYRASECSDSASGFAMGRESRGGRGWRNRFRATGRYAGQKPAAVPHQSVDRQQEIASLKAAVDGLARTLGAFQKRLDELEVAPKAQ